MHKTCTGSSQPKLPTWTGRGHEDPTLAQELLATGGYLGEEEFSSGMQPLEGNPSSSTESFFMHIEKTLSGLFFYYFKEHTKLRKNRVGKGEKGKGRE